MDESFCVVVASNENEDFFPHNNNFHFSNIFPGTLNLENYEVGLSSITFYDRFIKVDPTPIPDPDQNEDFFDTDKKENEIKVEQTQRNIINFTKDNPDLPSFLASVITECAASNIGISFMQQFKNNVIVRIQIILRAPSGWQVEITDPLLSILGFEQSEFQSGTYDNTLEVDHARFAAIKLNEPIGSIVLFKRETSAVYLEQIKGTPTISGILGKIVLLLGTAGHNISIVLKKKARTIEYKYFNLIRVNFSKRINDFIGLPENFVFSGQGSMQIADSIVYPDRSVLPTEKPKLSWCKALVMCDIIDDQIVAGKETKLLAVLDRQESQVFKRFYHAPSQIVYKSVCKPFIHQISISLKADNTNFLDFTEQPTTAVLHFRKKLLE